MNIEKSFREIHLFIYLFFFYNFINLKTFLILNFYLDL